MFLESNFDLDRCRRCIAINLLPRRKTLATSRTAHRIEPRSVGGGTVRVILALRPGSFLRLGGAPALPSPGDVMSRSAKCFLGHDYQTGFERLLDLDEEANVPSRPFSISGVRESTWWNPIGSTCAEERRGYMPPSVRSRKAGNDRYRGVRLCPLPGHPRTSARDHHANGLSMADHEAGVDHSSFRWPRLSS